MRRLPVILTVLALLAAACGGSDANSCEAVADDAVALIQELVDEVSSMSLEELAAEGDDIPEPLAQFEDRAQALQQRSDDLGCGDEEMQQLVATRLDRLESDSPIGQLLIDGFKQDFFGGGEG